MLNTFCLLAIMLQIAGLAWSYSMPVLAGCCTALVVIAIWRLWTRFRIGRIVNETTDYIRHRNIMKSMLFVPEAVLTLDADGAITYVNKRAKKYFGLTEDELRKGGIQAIMPKARIEEFHYFRLTHSEMADESSLETEGYRKDQTIFPMEVTIGRWQDDEVDNEIFYTLVIRDISHRRKNELMLRALQDEIYRISGLSITGETILNAGSWCWNMVEDDIIYSEQFRKLFCLRIGEKVNGKDLMKRIYKDDVAHVNEVMVDAIERQVRYEVDYRIVQEDGSLCLVHCIGVPAPSETRSQVVNGVIQVIQKDANA